jgi:hypothetical protein
MPGVELVVEERNIIGQEWSTTGYSYGEPIEVASNGREVRVCGYDTTQALADPAVSFSSGAQVGVLTSSLRGTGVPLEEISQLVGHSGTAVTELVYRHQLKPVIQSGATVCRGEGRAVNVLVGWVGLSGLEPLTSALSGMPGRRAEAE